MPSKYRYSPAPWVQFTQMKYVVEKVTGIVVEKVIVKVDGIKE